MDVHVVATIGQALSDPTRVQVLELCNGKVAVGEIARALGVSSPTVSHHLALLERAGLVEVVRRGRRHVLRRVDHGVRVLARELG
jgi:DNA-binding transcriptional ArsR family regulator